MKGGRSLTPLCTDKSLVLTVGAKGAGLHARAFDNGRLVKLNNRLQSTKVLESMRAEGSRQKASLAYSSL